MVILLAKLGSNGINLNLAVVDQSTVKTSGGVCTIHKSVVQAAASPYQSCRVTKTVAAARATYML